MSLHMHMHMHMHVHMSPQLKHSSRNTRALFRIPSYPRGRGVVECSAVLRVTLRATLSPPVLQARQQRAPLRHPSSKERLQAAVGRLSDPPPPARDSVGFLKEHLGFGGLVVSDLGGVDQLRGGSLTRFAAAINAGVDMVMLPGALRLLAPIASQLRQQ